MHIIVHYSKTMKTQITLGESRALPMPFQRPRQFSTAVAAGQVTRCANYPRGRLSFKLD